MCVYILVASVWSHAWPPKHVSSGVGAEPIITIISAEDWASVKFGISPVSPLNLALRASNLFSNASIKFILAFIGSYLGVSYGAICNEKLSEKLAKAGSQAQKSKPSFINVYRFIWWSILTHRVLSYGYIILRKVERRLVNFCQISVGCFGGRE